MNDTERNIQYHTLAFLTLELFVLMIHSVRFTLIGLHANLHHLSESTKSHPDTQYRLFY